MKRFHANRRRVGIGVVATLAVAIGAGARAGRFPSQAPDFNKGAALAEFEGHPSALTVKPAARPSKHSALFDDTNQRGGVPFEVPPLSPLASGPFVNFESPQVKPLALSSDGVRLFAANTPNNRLVVLDTTAGLNVVTEIPVGLDPVALAVQPGTNDERVWVANFISDSVSVVDVVAGKVVAVIAVGDEPVNILFDELGQHAFVVIQGVGAGVDWPSADPHQVQAGNVVVVDAASHQVVSTTFLDCNVPRSAVWDPVRAEIVVAALASGNNTTVVGRPITKQINVGPPADPNGCEQACNCDCVATTILDLVQAFSATAGIFAATPGLQAWPDVHETPGFPASPKVHRIVSDMGTPGGWNAIVDLLSDANGDPDPAMVALMNQELNLLNAEAIIRAILEEAKDTDDYDLVVLDASNPRAPAGLPVLRRIERVGTTLTGMARNPATGGLFVANMEARNVVRLVTDLRGHIVDHQIVKLGGTDGPVAVAAKDLHEGIASFNDVSGPNPVAQAASLAHPMDIVFDDLGRQAYVAAFGPGRVASLSGETAAVVDRVDVGRGPRGLALDSANSRLYVMNRTDLSISVVDVTDPAHMAVLSTVPLFNPEPPAIRDGRDFLFSTRFSNNFASSCGVCHIDGNHDFLAWDLGSPVGDLQPGPPNVPAANHPLKGPMVTLSLRGLRNHQRFHWRSDKIVFQDFNEAFVNLLGAEDELSDENMDAYTAFIHTVEYGPNPFYNRDNSFKDHDRMFNGGVLFLANCDFCHRVGHDGAMPGWVIDPPVEDDAGIDVSGGSLFAQLQEVTQLREIQKKSHMDRFTGFGLIHDGREKREGNEHPLQTFLLQFFPAIGPEDRLDMIAFMNAFQSNAMSVIGAQVLLKPIPQPSGPPVLPVNAAAGVKLLVSQFAKQPSHCDVVAHGIVGGQLHGYVLTAHDPAIIFQSDDGSAMTLNALLDALGTGDSLVFSAVPPGSGRRMGIDQDLDCLADGQDSAPQANNAGDGNFDGMVGAGDFTQMFQCSLLDGPLGPECLLYDMDCNAILNSEDLDAFLAVFQGPQNDCNGNGTVDLMDIFTGASYDNDANAVPDECLAYTVAVAGARYLKVEVTGTEPVALQVSSPKYPCWTQYADADGYLVDVPILHTPSEWGAVYVGDSLIVPATTYLVRADTGWSLSRESAAVTRPWGEVNGIGPIDVDDIVCVLDAFVGLLTQCWLPDVDLASTIPNRLVDSDDILAVLGAFVGEPYPFELPCE